MEYSNGEIEILDLVYEDNELDDNDCLSTTGKCCGGNCHSDKE
jgi:hypothetical protein